MITAIVLGGVSIDGGKGYILGVIQVVFNIGVIRKGMYALNISREIMKISIGTLLSTCILIPRFLFRGTWMNTGARENQTLSDVCRPK